MNAFPKVNILLSTFNGMEFLGEQLDSLQAQDYPNIFIYIRDDGSTDGTVAFLQTYQKQFSNVDLTLGENVGYKRSFFELTLR
ncbi:glycosyltransferase [Phormidium sp. CLA17]|uniref:glycosyltransferase n=1 Tax=Leptolyngbya sp. Cla-17 TaxID=2803751 RepID=UPI001492D7EC|nr:glycosyltransferase [Leptolyngbya sp. Cla-17]MBM0744657.1 glycosyltransferase [Leptolyngbya sp. Cla-17]